MAPSATAETPKMSLRAHIGDAKTLLAWDLLDTTHLERLAGFTIRCQPEGRDAYYLQNMLRFRTPGNHAQDAEESAHSSINAPIHKFRWLHVPGSVHQGLKPLMGKYTYTVTARFFDDSGSLQPLDATFGVSVAVQVKPFERSKLKLGFTRGFTQSQAFVRHFGLKARIRPDTDALLFDTSEIAGSDATGTQYSYEDEYEWSGFTARERIFELVREVAKDKKLRLDLFAYDLNEPDLMRQLLDIAAQGRLRIILDNAGLHHSTKEPRPEDEFEKLFHQQAAASSAIQRGKFGRYAHDKVFVVYDDDGPVRVLTGSTNFSVTGLYVNSNHVLVFDDRKIAQTYADVFEAAWVGEVKLKAALTSPLSSEKVVFAKPSTEITFAPHSEQFATEVLSQLAHRIAEEGTKADARGSVLFAVMSIDQGESPVYPALVDLHANDEVFSYGISDSKAGITLYKPGRRTGVLVTGKPLKTRLPKPFNQVRTLGGVGHQIHHKFVVCGFNGDDPTVFCGSSNLALGGEQRNGDNLLMIRDADVATAFAIEALALVDHFHFLNNSTPADKKGKTPPTSMQDAAVEKEWFLSTSGRWARPYFDPDDLRFVDRRLFA
jgi:PLD-like domain